MQIVIEIDEKIYKRILPYKNMTINSNLANDYPELMYAVANGVPLTKGHGRLIDADYLKNVALLHNFHGNNKSIVPYSDRKGYRLRQREVDEVIINAPTIIEADRSER